MIKVIGIIGIISVFVTIILYSIGNLQMNRGLIQHVINTTKDPKMPFTGWRKGMGDDFVGFGIKDYNPDNIDPNVGIELSFNVEVSDDVVANS